MEDVSTPSLNGELMPQFLGKRVRLICELENPGDGRTIVAKTCDKRNVTILKAPTARVPTTKFVEFIGSVVDATTLREETNCNFGDSFDMTMHNESVQLMNGKFSSLFKGAI